MEAAELVYKTLLSSEEPLRASEIADAANMDKKEVDKAMKALKAEGRIVSPKHCCWAAV